jgi:hypothetical protein
MSFDIPRQAFTSFLMPKGPGKRLDCLSMYKSTHMNKSRLYTPLHRQNSEEYSGLSWHVHQAKRLSYSCPRTASHSSPVIWTKWAISHVYNHVYMKGSSRKGSPEGNRWCNFFLACLENGPVQFLRCEDPGIMYIQTPMRQYTYSS